MTSAGARAAGKFIARSWLVDFALARSLPYLILPLAYPMAYVYGLGWSALHTLPVLRGAQPETELWIRVSAIGMPMLLRLLSVAVAAYLLPACLGPARRIAAVWLGVSIVLGELPRLVWPHHFPWWIPLFTAILPVQRKDLVPDVVLQHDMWPLASVLALVVPVCLIVAGRGLSAQVDKSPVRSGAAAA
jgi:hypothetical protein